MLPACSGMIRTAPRKLTEKEISLASELEIIKESNEEQNIASTASQNYFDLPSFTIDRIAREEAEGILRRLDFIFYQQVKPLRIEQLKNKEDQLTKFQAAQSAKNLKNKSDSDKNLNQNLD